MESLMKRVPVELYEKISFYVMVERYKDQIKKCATSIHTIVRTIEYSSKLPKSTKESLVYDLLIYAIDKAPSMFVYPLLQSDEYKRYMNSDMIKYSIVRCSNVHVADVICNADIEEFVREDILLDAIDRCVDISMLHILSSNCVKRYACEELLSYIFVRIDRSLIQYIFFEDNFSQFLNRKWLLHGIDNCKLYADMIVTCENVREYVDLEIVKMAISACPSNAWNIIFDPWIMTEFLDRSLFEYALDASTCKLMILGSNESLEYLSDDLVRRVIETCQIDEIFDIISCTNVSEFVDNECMRIAINRSTSSDIYSILTCENIDVSEEILYLGLSKLSQDNQIFRALMFNTGKVSKRIFDLSIDRLYTYRFIFSLICRYHQFIDANVVNTAICKFTSEEVVSLVMLKEVYIHINDETFDCILYKCLDSDVQYLLSHDDIHSRASSAMLERIKLKFEKANAALSRKRRRNI